MVIFQTNKFLTCSETLSVEGLVSRLGKAFASRVLASLLGAESTKHHEQAIAHLSNLSTLCMDIFGESHAITKLTNLQLDNYKADFQETIESAKVAPCS